MDKITYDDYFSYMQNSEEGKIAIAETKKIESEKRYKSRGMMNNGIDSQEAIKLNQMTQSEFENLRRYQMGQLYNAYKNKALGGHQMQMDVWSVTDTNMSNVRRVTGNQPGYIYNNGILALSQDDINVISNIVIQQTQNQENYDYRTSTLTPLSLEKIVDEMQAIRSVALENIEISPTNLTFSKLSKETNVLKRTMGKVEGKNVFYISDYDECAKAQSKGAISKLMEKIAHSIDKFLHPEAERFNENRFGNKEIGEI